MPGIFSVTVMLRDDALATGTTMRAAVEAVRQLDPKQIVDRIVCGETPGSLYALGL